MTRRRRYIIIKSCWGSWSCTIWFVSKSEEVIKETEAVESKVNTYDSPKEDYVDDVVEQENV